MTPSPHHRSAQSSPLLWFANWKESAKSIIGIPKNDRHETTRVTFCLVSPAAYLCSLMSFTEAEGRRLGSKITNDYTTIILSKETRDRKSESEQRTSQLFGPGAPHDDDATPTWRCRSSVMQNPKPFLHVWNFFLDPLSLSFRRKKNNASWIFVPLRCNLKMSLPHPRNDLWNMGDEPIESNGSPTPPRHFCRNIPKSSGKSPLTPDVTLSWESVAESHDSSSFPFPSY